MEIVGYQEGLPVVVNPGIIDPKKFMGPGRDAVEALCIEKIRVCGSSGKAALNFSTID